MPAKSYTYNEAVDVPHTPADLGILRTELIAAQEAQQVAWSFLDFEASGLVGTRTIKLWFDAELSAADKTYLDGDTAGPCGGLIGAHNPAQKKVKILRFVARPQDYDPYTAPIDLDYKTGLTVRLHAKRTIVKGEVTQVEWYGTYDGTTFSDLVLRVTVSYTRNALGLALYRDTLREWFREDGTVATPTKQTRKWYLGNDRGAELERRASNALDAQKTLGLGAIIADQMTNHGKTQDEAIAIGLGYADEWFAYFRDQVIQFKATTSRQYFDAIVALQNQDPPVDLQWARDTPNFLTVVKAEVNFGNWS